LACDVLPRLRSPGAGETLLHDLLSHFPALAIYPLACLAALPPQNLTAYIEATYSDGGDE
jgi:hypothetical protein